MDKFYEVKAKCGHVGKGYYYEGRFFVRAESGSMAANKIRYAPRVKHDHKDAILSVAEITYYEYVCGVIDMKENPYFYCHSVQQQAERMDEIVDNVYFEKTILDDETEIVYINDIAKYIKKRRIRNPYKFEKMNRICRIEVEAA